MDPEDVVTARAAVQTGRPRRSPPVEIVDTINFLLATRDSGYRSTAVAVAEFIDNAFQASARQVSVSVALGADPQWPLEIVVTDDGHGMDAGALQRALTFGGSTRFGDRQSLGRYGMGLPNGALSRARRVEVYSWQGNNVLWSRLDLDEVAGSRRPVLPPVCTADVLPFKLKSRTGTVVRLVRCDRVEYKRPSWLVRRLEEEFGRIYRRYLLAGKVIRVNGRKVDPIDPLFLESAGLVHSGQQFGDDLVYRVPCERGEGEITVRFSELPVERWHTLSVEEKRDRGISNTPPVSVLRADREIDRGWFFMGSKRRENYDDWWRCEVHFDPMLDELFGITHSKQAIVPSEELLDLLVPDLEPIGRALNGRARRRFELLKATAPLGAAERQAGRVDKALPRLPRRREPVPKVIEDVLHSVDDDRTPYRIVAAELSSTEAFDVVVRDGCLFLLLNSRHPLYRDFYGPLASSESPRDQEVAKHLVLTILSAARAEASLRGAADRARARMFRQSWADVFATFMSV